MADITTVEILSKRQISALEALVNEPSIRKAAEKSGIPERTIYAWLKNGEFDAAYRAMRRSAVSQATGRIQQASGAAVGVLFSLMQSGNPAAVRLAAASKVLDLAIRSIELDDMQQRIEALERAYAEKF